MKDYIRILWDTFDQTSDQDFPESQQAEELRKALSTTLDKDHSRMLLEMADLHDMVFRNGSYQSFASGLRLGVALMAKLYGYTPADD